MGSGDDPSVECSQFLRCFIRDQAPAVILSMICSVETHIGVDYELDAEHGNFSGGTEGGWHERQLIRIKRTTASYPRPSFHC